MPRQVAKDIGYSVGTLYNVFEHYDILILYINAKTLDQMIGELGDGFAEVSDARDRAQHLARGYLRFARDNRFLWNALFEHTLPSEMEVPEWYSEKIQRLFALVEHALAPRTSNPQDAQTMAKTLWAGIHGICVLGLSNKLNAVGAQPMESLMAQMIETYWAGISGRTIS